MVGQPWDLNRDQAKFNRGPDRIRVGILGELEDLFKVPFAEALMKQLAAVIGRIRFGSTRNRESSPFDGDLQVLGRNAWHGQFDFNLAGCLP